MSSLYLLARQVLAWTKSNLNLVARYIPSSQNVVADKFNCPDQMIGTEWSLHPLVSRRVFQIWRTPVVDLCESAQKKRPLLYRSLFPNPMAW